MELASMAELRPASMPASTDTEPQVHPFSPTSPPRCDNEARARVSYAARPVSAVWRFGRSTQPLHGSTSTYQDCIWRSSLQACAGVLNRSSQELLWAYVPFVFFFPS